MTKASLHLNFLKDNERLSSSPIRLRVMIPLFAILACVGMGVMWGLHFTQLMMVKSESKSLQADLTSKSEKHAKVIQQMDEKRELESQVAQLHLYRAGVRHMSEPLKNLAEVMPLKIQLTELTMTAPGKQSLENPNKNLPPLWGPTTDRETQQFIIVGRATRETPVQALMNSLEEDTFTNLVTRTRKIRSEYRKMGTAEDTMRYLSFELNYTMPERKFAQ